MIQDSSQGRRSRVRQALAASTKLLALAALPLLLPAQTTTLYGTLSNFDVINDTGQTTHGFEIELYNVNNVSPYTFSGNRYGSAQITPIPGGYVLRWASSYDAANQRFTQTTPLAPPNPTATNGHQCVMGNFNYQNSGCEHFGASGSGNLGASSAAYWLIEDPNNPGQLIRYGQAVAIPMPYWVMQPPVRPAAPPVVAVRINPPIPAPPPAPPVVVGPPPPQFGPAQWMKTYKTENARKVFLDELIADNPIVPEDEAHLETAWDLLQNDRLDVSNGRQRQKRGELGGNSQAVVRRFEFYKYSGPVDPVTGQALCADGTCSAPSPGELGGFIGAQNAAANIEVPPNFPVTVTVSGDGQVSSGDQVIRCPGVCTETLPKATFVSLTAKAGKGVFTGWTGACTHAALVCSFKLDSEATATATFVIPVKLSTKVNGLGTVLADQAGTSFLPGTVVKLTASPSPGNAFLSWGDACAGTQLTCTVTMDAAKIVTANFTGGVAPVPPTSYKLILKTAGGKGTIASNRAGSSFAAGTVVQLTATPDAGFTFTGWSGACIGNAPACSVTIRADTSVTANFIK
ncbi:MAG: hypothetical protein NTZ56_08720 [Acidobacteria bacterium]|nr:hypothetical protein [Acidobacteriota bacterium]